MEALDLPLLELAVLDYFSRIDCLHPMGRDMVSTEDLADAGYFTGRSRLQTKSLLALYGSDPDGFTAIGRHLGGRSEKMGNAALRLTPFPRVPVYYLLWTADSEFESRMSILFDRSIETVMSAPAIWSLVTLCSYYLLRGPKSTI